jgi:FHS family glucose/mannose:H+ symporter-like MFS transporter
MMSSKTQIQPNETGAPSAVIFYLLCAGFVVNGIVISFIGPLLPVFSAKWGLDDARAGYFLLVQFLASFIGVLISSRLIAAKGFKPAITIGLALLGIGFALLSAPTFPLALVASGIYGLGYGFNTPGTNLWVSESYGERRASALNIVNLAWGVGAIASSPLAKFTIRTATVNILLYVVGATCVAGAAILVRMKFGQPHQPVEASESLPASSKNGLGVAALLGVLFFVYVGTEVGTSSWSSMHAQRATEWATNNWALTPMFFFAGLLGGRGAAAAILLRLKEVTVAVSGLFVAGAGELIFITAHSPAALFGGAFCAGLGLSSLYPIWVAWLSKWFGARARKVGGVMFALAALGSASMPWLVGVVSKYYLGNLRVGLLVPLIGCAVMLATIALLRPSRRA